MLIIVVSLILLMVILELIKEKELLKPNSEESGNIYITCTAKSEAQFNYIGVSDCSVISENFPENKKCESSCIGAFSCVEECPKSAIGKDLIIDNSKCDDCGICVEICPKDLIVRSGYNSNIYLSCASIDKDGETRCQESCLRCYICVSSCPRRAISINESGLPKVDSEMCDNCRLCVRKCPSGSLKTIRSL